MLTQSYSIVAGISSEIDPVLVLSGVTEMSDLNLFAYHPFVILGGVYEIPSDDDKNKLTDSDLEEASRRVSMNYGFLNIVSLYIL
jgi:NagD protein